MDDADRSTLANLFAAAIDIAKTLDPLAAMDNPPGETAGSYGIEVGGKLRDLHSLLEKVPTIEDIPPDVFQHLRSLGEIVRIAKTECVAYGDMALHLARSEMRNQAAAGWKALVRSKPENENVLSWVRNETTQEDSAEAPIQNCIWCGCPIGEYDKRANRSTCHKCRSPKGKVADLDIAIRASGDTPKRIAGWKRILFLIRKRCSHLQQKEDETDEVFLIKQLDEVYGWLENEGVRAEIYLRWKLEFFIAIVSGEKQFGPHKLKSISRTMQRCADDLDRALKQDKRPLHLAGKMNRIRFQAVGLTLDMLDWGIDLGNELENRLMLCPVAARRTVRGFANVWWHIVESLNHAYPDRFRWEAGSRMIPRVKTNDKDQWLGRDGKPLVWRSVTDSETGITEEGYDGEFAHEEDDFDDPDKMDRYRLLAEDDCAALELLAEIATANIVELPTEIDQGRQVVATATEQKQPDPPAEHVFAPNGSGYIIAGFGERGHFGKLKGFDRIYRLLQAPGQAVSMLELVDAGSDTRVKADSRSQQPILDPDKKRELVERLSTARADRERAIAENDNVEVMTCNEEIERCETLLKAGTGLAGRDRDLNRLPDKLRPQISGTIETALKKLRAAQPPMTELANHFKAGISADGATFTYQPPAKPYPNWKFSPE